MNFARSFLCFAIAVVSLPAAFAQTGFPFQSETLHYTVNWPSGLSLGDATLTAHHGENGWGFEIRLDAGIPGFSIADKYHSSVAPDLCSLELTRDISHGPKKNREKTVFDQKKGTARRVTIVPQNGGSSDFDIPGCARDAIAYLYYVRVEMGQGRVAPPQKVFFGSAYNVRVEYTGAVTIQSNDKPAVTDHVVTSVKGPKSDFTFEVFFARDAARTPLRVTIPLSVGAVSLELVR
jgi:hypothetical protein